MSDKRQIHKNIKRLQVIKTWQLVILFILMCFVSATFLRLNNTGMIERRNAVYAADKSGDTQNVSSRIYDLQRFSTAHMNASTGPVYLQESYNRDARTAMAGPASGASSDSPQARADAICNPNLQTHGYSLAYQTCMLNELTKAGQVADPAAMKLPAPALYRYNFVSPLWSADFAGWSLVVTVLILLAIIVRLITLMILRLLVRRHYREV